MKKIILLFLLTSLAANAWLLLRTSPAGIENAAAATPPHRAPEAEPTPAAAAVLRTLAKADVMDLTALRDALRAEGVDEATLRAVVEGVLRSRFHDDYAKWRMEQWRTAWWRGVNAPGGPRAPSRRATIIDPLRALLGPDPLDLVEAEARYDFLPPEKRRLMALMDLDYSELKSRAGPNSAGATQAELQEERLLAAERQKDVLAALTPEERAEYDLRYSTAAARNSRRFSAVAVTEPEYRIAGPIFNALQRDMEALARGASTDDRTALNQRAIDQLVSALGYDRALDFIWGLDSGPYAEAARTMRELNLPASNAAKLLQLSATTGADATAIHYDASLSPEQKRAALAALQQRVRPQLDALVPPAAQANLDESLAWFKVLGDGRYMQRSPTLIGAGYMVGTPMSVAAKPAGQSRTIPIAHPPGS